MPKVFAKAWLCVLLLGVSASGYAEFDFSNADDLFTARAGADGHGDIDKIKAGIDAYKAILAGGGLVANDTYYAGEQIARLYIYWSYVIDQSNVKARIALYDACMTSMKTIAPSQVGENPQYYYWSAVCLAQWGRALGVSLDALARSQELVDLIAAGKKVDPTYEGGGFHRMDGIVYSNLPAFNPFGPTGDMPKALQNLQASTEAGVYQNGRVIRWKSPDTETGEYFFETYVYYADALYKAGRRTEALQMLDESLHRIVDNADIPVGREPETEISRQRMIMLRDKINNDSSEG